jgi:hypothetical protein
MNPELRDRDEGNFRNCAPDREAELLETVGRRSRITVRGARGRSRVTVGILWRRSHLVLQVIRE